MRRKLGIIFLALNVEKYQRQEGGEQELTLQDVKKKIPAIQRQLNGGQKKIVVIDGPSGPTGKTTAARLLADAGVPVYEEYQVLRITMDEPIF